MRVETCHMCGMPSDCIAGEGVRIVLRFKPANNFRRESKRTAWCCSKSCAVQAFAVSRMGVATHKWPVSLAEFATAHREEIERAIVGRSDRTEMASDTRINSGSDEGDFRFMGLPHREAISVRKGRPRKWQSEAERLRAWRRTKAMAAHA